MSVFLKQTIEVLSPHFLYFTQTYKTPLTKDVPLKFNVKFLRNAPNPVGVLGSKGEGLHGNNCTKHRECTNSAVVVSRGGAVAGSRVCRRSSGRLSNAYQCGGGFFFFFIGLGSQLHPA